MEAKGGSWWLEAQRDGTFYTQACVEFNKRMAVTTGAQLVDAIVRASVACYRDNLHASKPGGMGMKAGAN